MTPTEQQEGEAFHKWLCAKGYWHTHIPNETGSDPHARARAVRMKRAGVSKGFPDYIILIGSHTLAVELKRVKGYHVQPEQTEWLQRLADAGWHTAICHGAKEAIEFCEEYLPKDKPVENFTF